MLLKLKDIKTKIVDTAACRSLLLKNILVIKDTVVIDTLKDQCNNDSAHIKYNVTINPTETVRTINNTAINFLDKIMLTTTSSAPVTWSGPGLSCYNCLSPITAPALTANTYIVKAGSGSCVATDTVIISIKATDTLYVPSAFTPNGDGKNDVFNALGVVNDFQMEIYNRWGERIFKTSSLLNGWDGMCKGSIQPYGTYVYYIKYTSKTNFTKLLKGTFTLIR
jgi:gliding motility-associated-like protein